MTNRRGHENRWKALVFIGISLLVISLDNTILNVALPSIISRATLPTALLIFNTPSFDRLPPSMPIRQLIKMSTVAPLPIVSVSTSAYVLTFTAASSGMIAL